MKKFDLAGFKNGDYQHIYNEVKEYFLNFNKAKEKIQNAFISNPYEAFQAARLLLNQYRYAFGCDLGGTRQANNPNIEASDWARISEFDNKMACQQFEGRYSWAINKAPNEKVINRYPEVVLLKGLESIINQDISDITIKNRPDYANQVNIVLNLIGEVFQYYGNDFDKAIDNTAKAIADNASNLRDFGNFIESPSKIVSIAEHLFPYDKSSTFDINRNYYNTLNKVLNLCQEIGDNDNGVKVRAGDLDNVNFDGVADDAKKTTLNQQLALLKERKAAYDEYYNSFFGVTGFYTNKLRFLLVLKEFKDIINDSMAQEDIKQKFETELSKLNDLIPSGPLNYGNYQLYLSNLLEGGYITAQDRTSHLNSLKTESLKKLAQETDDFKKSKKIIDQYVPDDKKMEAINDLINNEIEKPQNLEKLEQALAAAPIILPNINDKVTGYLNYAVFKKFMNNEFPRFVEDYNELNQSIITKNPKDASDKTLYAIVHNSTTKLTDDNINLLIEQFNTLHNKTAVKDALSEKSYKKFKTDTVDNQRFLIFRTRSKKDVIDEMIKVYKGACVEVPDPKNPGEMIQEGYNTKEVFISNLIHEYRVLKMQDNEKPVAIKPKEVKPTQPAEKTPLKPAAEEPKKRPWWDLYN